MFDDMNIYMCAMHVYCCFIFIKNDTGYWEKLQKDWNELFR